MGDITTGNTFQGGDTVTASKLNGMINDATINPTLITGKTVLSSLADDDMLLALDVSTGEFAQIEKGNLVTAGVAGTGFRRLVIQNNVANPTTKFDVLAEEVVLRSAANAVIWLDTLSGTVDTALYSAPASLNGRDFVNLTGSTWYYIWGISNGDTSGAMLSTSSTAPTLPTGYTYSCLLGAVYAVAGVFMNSSQRGLDVAIECGSKAGVVAAEYNPITGGAEFTNVGANAVIGTFQSVQLTKCCPPNLTSSIRGIIGSTTLFSAVERFSYALASVGVGLCNQADTPTSALGVQVFSVISQNADSAMMGFKAAACFDIPIHTNQTIYWASDNDATPATHNMRITGFRLTL